MLRTLHDAEFQHLHDLFHRCPCLDDVPARAGRVHVRVRCIERDAQELELLGGHDAALVNPDGGGHELVGPHRIECEERVLVTTERGRLVLARY